MKPFKTYPDIPLQDAYALMVADIRAPRVDRWRIAVWDRLNRGTEPMWVLRLDRGEDRGHVAIIDAPHGEQWWSYSEHRSAARALADGRRELIKWIARESKAITKRDGGSFRAG